MLGSFMNKKHKNEPKIFYIVTFMMKNSRIYCRL